MKTLNDLCIEGLECCKFRGHEMEVVKVDKESQEAYYDCVKCKMGFCANLHPLPNEIDLGGEALALHCV